MRTEENQELTKRAVPAAPTFRRRPFPFSQRIVLNRLSLRNLAKSRGRNADLISGETFPGREESVCVSSEKLPRRKVASSPIVAFFQDVHENEKIDSAERDFLLAFNDFPLYFYTTFSGAPRYNKWYFFFRLTKKIKRDNLKRTIKVIFSLIAACG